jgi:phenylpropionate dioxygenase-like ring-hydroxylating dioxygenase large terminal subunit
MEEENFFELEVPMIPNMWYAVLDSKEVKPGKPYAFKRLNEELVFWRDKSGKIVVMRDRCPHRSCKLSPGKIIDGQLQCHFHGF